jgi:hypothetical protein
MPPVDSLLGRGDTIRRVKDLGEAGRSVLLVGPEGVGKSAIIAAVADSGWLVVDPLERTTSRRASDIRRGLDRGRVYLAAARQLDRAVLGSVGRILWRFSILRVRELPTRLIRRIIATQLAMVSEVAASEAWTKDVVHLAQGRPGAAIAMAQFADAWRHAHGSWPSAPLIDAVLREQAARRLLALDARDASRKSLEVTR